MNNTLAELRKSAGRLREQQAIKENEASLAASLAEKLESRISEIEAAAPREWNMAVGSFNSLIHPAMLGEHAAAEYITVREVKPIKIGEAEAEAWIAEWRKSRHIRINDPKTMVALLLAIGIDAVAFDE